MLTSYCLTWYKDEYEKEPKFKLWFDGRKLEDVYKNDILSRRHTFALFFADGRKEIKLKENMNLPFAIRSGNVDAMITMMP